MGRGGEGRGGEMGRRRGREGEPSETVDALRETCGGLLHVLKVDRRDGDVMLSQEGCPGGRRGYCACERMLPTIDLSLNHSLLLPQL